MQIPNSIINVMQELNNAGYECYLVGGCVRDSLMGKTPHDFDLTTSALPEQTLSVFSNRRVIETGLKHGTITILTDIGGVEITTYRIDGVYLDSRRPETVSFTRNLTEDLARRDFTVNAMAMSFDGGVVDMYGGKADLEGKLIRCVGDAEKRFSEDALRILRALRFASVLDFDIDPDTSAAIRNMHTQLSAISAERIREEISKLICGVAAKRVVSEYKDVLETIISCNNIEKLPLLPNDPCIRMAAMHQNEQDLLATLKRLKCSRVQIKTATDCFRVLNLNEPPTPTTVARLAANIGLEQLKGFLTAACAFGTPLAAEYRQMLTQLENRNACFSLADLNINGATLIKMGIKGRAVGQMLDRLFYAVAEGECENTLDELISYVKNT